MDEKTNLISRVSISILPIIYWVDRIPQAVLLGASVLFSLLIFEGLFSLTRRFWAHWVRPLLAMVVLASILKGIALVSRLLSFKPVTDQESICSLAAVSAFLLGYRTLVKRESIRNRLKSWIGFLGLLLAVGFVRQVSGVSQTVLPLPFWIVGGALAFFSLWQNKKASK